jgi:SAM-dependent methyltransferase
VVTFGCSRLSEIGLRGIGLERERKERRERLDLDVEALRKQLGPVKVALIGQWIAEVVGPLDDAIERGLHSDATVLDAGCSRGDPDLPALAGARLYIGSDTDMAGLRANALADSRICATLAALPLAADSVDMVVLKWVAEHLDDPLTVFTECRRVLRPGGRLCILTPNRYSFFTFVSASIPYRLKQVLKRWMFGLHEEDTFPTFYRANDRGRLQGLLAAPDWAREEFRYLPGMWTFFIFSPRLARLVRRLEQVQMQAPLLDRCATYILGVWQKQ